MRAQWPSPLLLVFFTGCFCILAAEASGPRPIVGVLTVPTYKQWSGEPTMDRAGLAPWGDQYDCYIPAGYTKLVESGMVRAALIPCSGPWAEFEAIVKGLNGFVFTGMFTDFQAGNGQLTEYGQRGKYIYEQVLQANQQGVRVPLYAECKGFNMLSFFVASNVTYWLDLIRDNINATDLAAPIQWNPAKEYNQTKFYEAAAATNSAALLTTGKNLMNRHPYGLLPANYTSNNGLMSFFGPYIATTTDGNGVEFVSVVEHPQYPIYGVATHPEKVIYEWNPTIQTPHTDDGLQANLFFGRMIGDAARGNGRNFLNATLERKVLTNYNTLANTVSYFGGEFRQSWFINPVGYSSSAESFAHHGKAVMAGNVSQIMTDYALGAVLQTYNTASNTNRTYRGKAEIETFWLNFTSNFAISNCTDMKGHLTKVNTDSAFTVWSCASLGILSGSDTIVYDPTTFLMKQHDVVFNWPNMDIGKWESCGWPDNCRCTPCSGLPSYSQNCADQSTIVVDSYLSEINRGNLTEACKFLGGGIADDTYIFTLHADKNLVPTGGSYVGCAGLQTFFALLHQRTHNFALDPSFAPGTHIKTLGASCAGGFATVVKQWEENAVVSATGQPITKALNTVVYKLSTDTIPPKLISGDVFIDGTAYAYAFCKGTVTCFSDGVASPSAQTTRVGIATLVFGSITVVGIIFIVCLICCNMYHANNAKNGDSPGVAGPSLDTTHLTESMPNMPSIQNFTQNTASNPSIAKRRETEAHRESWARAPEPPSMQEIVLEKPTVKEEPVRTNSPRSRSGSGKVVHRPRPLVEKEKHHNPEAFNI